MKIRNFFRKSRRKFLVKVPHKHFNYVNKQILKRILKSYKSDFNLFDIYFKMSFLFPFGLLRRFFNVKAEEHSPEVDKTTSKGLRRNHYDVVIVSRYYKLRFNNPIFTICHFYLTIWYLTSRSKKVPTHPGD